MDPLRTLTVRHDGRVALTNGALGNGSPFRPKPPGNVRSAGTALLYD
jgi:hypothetical protein